MSDNPNKYLPYIIPYMFVIVSLIVIGIYLIRKKYQNQGVYDVTNSKDIEALSTTLMSNEIKSYEEIFYVENHKVNVSYMCHPLIISSLSSFSSSFSSPSLLPMYILCVFRLSCLAYFLGIACIW